MVNWIGRWCEFDQILYVRGYLPLLKMATETTTNGIFVYCRQKPVPKQLGRRKKLVKIGFGVTIPFSVLIFNVFCIDCFTLFFSLFSNRMDLVDENIFLLSKSTIVCVILTKSTCLKQFHGDFCFVQCKHSWKKN